MARSRKRVVLSYPAQPAQLPLYTPEQVVEVLADVRENPDPHGARSPLAKAKGRLSHLICGCTVFLRREDEPHPTCPVHAERKVGGA